MLQATLRVALLGVVFSCSLNSQYLPNTRYFSTTIANDVFFLPLKTDRYFTSGIQFEWGKVKQTKADLAPVSTTRTKRYWRINQDIFTPQEIASPHLQPDDRPFASYLTISRGNTFTAPGFGFQLRRQWTAGVLGKYSQGGRLQNALHNMVAFAEAIPGWVHEVKPDLLLNYEIQLRKSYPLSTRVRAALSLRGRLGTLYTDIRPGVSVAAIAIKIKEEGWLRLDFSAANLIVGYNATLTGGLLNRDERYRSTILPQRSVWSYSTKAELHYSGYTLSGGVRWMSPEFRGGMHHVWAWFGVNLPVE